MQPVSQPYFPDEEWNDLHRADIGAGKVIVGLLTAVFTFGVLLYVFVLTLVGTDSW